MRLIVFIIVVFSCASLKVSLTVEHTQLVENNSHYETVVIGAGIAGITAASELIKMGKNVIILQANNYVGGRLKTLPVQMGNGINFQFDEGASWIHGSNPQHPITKLSNIVKGVAMKQTDDGNIQVYDQKGKEVTKQTNRAFKVYNKIFQQSQKQKASISLAQSFQKLKKGITNDKFAMFNAANDVQFQTSGSLQNIIAKCYDDEKMSGKQMLIVSGYQNFAIALKDKYNINVYLNHKVNKITFKDGKNQIQCQNGATVTANNVVVAVPIGVLKSKNIQFIPKLPAWKQDAIKSIGFGNVCKVLVQFPNKNYFDSKSHYIGVVADNVKQRGLVSYFLNLQALAGIPALMTFGLGPNADQVEKMSQEQLKKIIAKRISAFSHEQVSPNDFTIKRSSWRNNKNFNGAYSYASITTKPNHWKDMAEPIQNCNWYFCGQHTNFEYRSTVHGAYLSGVEVGKLIKQKQLPNSDQQ